MTPPPPERRTTVLVTGAAGFIGSVLCERLAAAGHDVIAFDDLSRGRSEYLPSAVRLIQGDIRDGRALDEAFAATEPAWVIHLAAQHFIPDCIARPEETIAVNVGGTAHVLESAGRTGSVRRVILASSAAVYAPVDEPCVENRTPLRPIEVYGESKLAAERLAADFHAATGISTSVLRLFNAIGRRETNPHVVPHIFESLRTSDIVPLGDTAPRRDYIDTRDVADAVIAAARTPEGLHVLNVGTGVAHSVDEIVAALRRLLGRAIVVETEPSRRRATERPLLVADIGRMRRTTGWTPRVTLDESLRDLAAAYGLVSDEYFSGKS